MLYKSADGKGLVYVKSDDGDVLRAFLDQGDWVPASRRERIRYGFVVERFSIIEVIVMIATAVAIMALLR